MDIGRVQLSIAMLKALEQDEGFQKLRWALTGRLHQAYQMSFQQWTRAAFQDKARSVTAGWDLRDAHGPEALAAVVDAFYDEEIPHFDKPENDRPPKKRARPDGSTDPDTITDRELEFLRCRMCSKHMTTRDACYTRERQNTLGYDIVCLPCWQKDYRETHCARCGGTAATIIYNLGICVPCRDKETPPRVVRMRRTKDGMLLQTADVYIGRRCTRGGWQLDESVWHNPYVLPARATAAQRDAVLAQYAAYVRGRPMLVARLAELGGKTLGCWCHPKPCHGDTLVALWKEYCAPVHQ